jgi:hypothetical protein
MIACSATSPARNSFRFTSFPNPLKRYQNTPLITPFVSQRFAVCAPQLFSFDIVSNNTGVGVFGMSKQDPSSRRIAEAISANPCRMRTSEKSRFNSFRMCTSKIIGLKVLQNEHFRKNPGGGVHFVKFAPGQNARAASLERIHGVCLGWVCGKRPARVGEPLSRHAGIATRSGECLA